MKKSVMMMVVCMALTLPASAQTWNKWDTRSTISGVLGIANAAIESAERKKEMEIQARQKVEFEQSFKDAMEAAKVAEAASDWTEALEKYEEASKLNCKYEYTDQRSITKKMNSLYAKAGIEDDGPSFLNNDKTILPSYDAYRYVRENPVYVNKKECITRIVRVACSNTETRLELEYVSQRPNEGMAVKGSAYIKGNKGGKLGIVSVENITMSPSSTNIPWPYQKLRFALIFPPLPAEAKEFDFIEPSSVWQFKDIKCK